VKDADFLEHRINEFLAERRDNWQPTQQELDRVKESIVNNLRQQDTSLSNETARNWDQILDKELGFDVREKKIAAYSQVTLEAVKSLFNSLFFSNPSRLNIKLHSHAHAISSERQQACQLNSDFYQNLSMK
jgi:secreted Zn-dependent insulinase-like peptidase